jgi:GT2 family glycosyltransferase
MGKDLNVSIVLYNSEFSQIEDLIKNLKTSPRLNQIYLIDNSPLSNYSFQSCEAIYIFTGKNLGYGAGHNLALQKSMKNNIKYHLVLNSDITLNTNVLEALLQEMESTPEVGLIMPKILNLDGSVQLLPKLLPTPFNLLIRVNKLLGKMFYSKNQEYTLENYLEKKLDVPIISGCFSLFRIDSLKVVGLYDQNFFMYFEDFDLSRRMHKMYMTIYYPKVSVIHVHERGAKKRFKLFILFILSAIKYFNKYGWFIDHERKKINKRVMDQIKFTS